MPAPAWPVISGRGVSKLNKAFQFMRGDRAPVGVDYTATRAPLPGDRGKGKLSDLHRRSENRAAWKACLSFKSCIFTSAIRHVTYQIALLLRRVIGCAV